MDSRYLKLFFFVWIFRSIWRKPKNDRTSRSRSFDFVDDRLKFRQKHSKTKKFRKYVACANKLRIDFDRKRQQILASRQWTRKYLTKPPFDVLHVYRCFITKTLFVWVSCAAFFTLPYLWLFSASHFLSWLKQLINYFDTSTPLDDVSVATRKKLSLDERAVKNRS